jgi:hypothetical protein
MPTNNLAAFIADLRRRLEQHDLSQGPLSLGNEVTLVNVEQAVRSLLADVDFFAQLPAEQRQRYPWRGQRLKLADTLRRLQRALQK